MPFVSWMLLGNRFAWLIKLWEQMYHDEASTNSWLLIQVVCTSVCPPWKQSCATAWVPPKHCSSISKHHHWSFWIHTLFVLQSVACIKHYSFRMMQTEKERAPNEAHSITKYCERYWHILSLAVSSSAYREHRRRRTSENEQDRGLITAMTGSLLKSPQLFHCCCL